MIDRQEEIAEFKEYKRSLDKEEITDPRINLALSLIEDLEKEIGSLKQQLLEENE